MTNQEAINYLLDPLSLPESMDIKDKLRWHEDAVNMAIEALKAQDAKPDEKANQEHGGSAEFGSKTGETCADAISRQDAIDALNEYFARIGKLKRRGLTKGEKAISLDTVGIIKTLPSAQPETCEGCKHMGKWENEVEYGYPSPCTCCKRRVEDNYE